MPLAHPEPIWTTSNSELAQHCQQWITLDAVALDTEFIRTDTFYPQPGLIQLGTGSDVFLIDPLMIDDWKPFAEFLENSHVIKVLHACSEDLEVFKCLTGAVPVGLFDTQLAAAYANIGFSMGYQALLKHVLNIDVPKDETRSNWRQRPLTESQIRYASLDVVHLLEVYEALQQLLDDKPHADWILDDCFQMTQGVLSSDPENAWKEVKRAWQLRPQQLAVLKALCIYREEESRQLDVPRNRVIAKGSLWSLARYQPKNMRKLSEVQDMKPPVLRGHGEAILSIIKHSASTEEDQWPGTLPPPLPKSAKDYGKQIKKIMSEQAETLQLPVELLLSGKATTPILRTWLNDGQFSLPESMNGWRREVIGEPLIEQLNQGT
ncbi:ribonuclease D [Endozoicomonas sp. (ex Bugula neritina AB1)]|nr:ribonuclease D [Endozoicomonas sp. (ex Bugula neritina AB1)]